MGTYPSGTFCYRCAASCRSCDGPLATDCLTCGTNLVLEDDGSCTDTCSLGQFADPNTNQCADCAAPCRTCELTPSTCRSCSGGRILYNSACVTQCPAGTYTDVALNRCVACQESCANCTGPSSLECTSCPAGSLLSGGECLIECRTGTFRNTTSGICQACNSTCRSCRDSANFCTGCPNGRYLDGNSCVLSCSSNDTFEDTRNNRCSVCDSSCAECSGPSATSCTRCRSGFVLNSGACLAVCPVGRFNSTNGCAACSSLCLTCESSTTLCTSCPAGRYLTNGTCVTSGSCPTGTYADDTTNRCIACSGSCATCSGPSRTECTTCATPRVLQNGQCLVSCNTGFFSNAGLCTACNGACATCDGPTAQDCVSCPGGQLLQVNQCVSQCGAGFIQDSSVAACVPCRAACAACGPSATQCTACSVPRFLEGTDCVAQCSTGFGDPVTRRCATCDLTCATCDGPEEDACVTCPPNRSLYLGRCVTQCPEGTRNSDGVCLARTSCDPESNSYVSTISQLSRSNPRFNTVNNPSISGTLCAYGTSGSNCIVAGARLTATLSTTFSFTADLNCQLACNAGVTRDYTARFVVNTVVSQDIYRLNALVNNDLNDNFENAALDYISGNSADLESMYTQGESAFRAQVDANRQAICQNIVDESSSTTSLSARSAVLTPIGGSFPNLCTPEAYVNTPASVTSGIRRCLCDSSVSGLEAPCADARVNDGTSQALCHPNQCVPDETDSEPFIQVTLAQSYAMYSNDMLVSFLQRINAYVQGNIDQVGMDTVVVYEVFRATGTNQVVVRFGLEDGVASDLDAMDQLASALERNLVDLTYQIVSVATSFRRQSGVTPVTVLVPNPVPVPVDVLVPVPVDVPNPVAVPVPVRVITNNPIPIPVPVEVPVPVVVYESAASSLSLALGLLVALVFFFL